jgi:hexosaminidase
MKKILSAINIFLLPVLVSAQPALHIIPQPVSVQMKQGQFVIDGSTAIQFNKSNKDLQGLAAFLASYIKNISGYNLPLNAAKRKAIHLSVEKTEGVGKEGYLLNVSPAGISIRANSRAGVFYAIQSLIQTLPVIRTNVALQVPAMGITDYPRFQWRGMHLDVSRHFFSPELVKQYIDLMAQYKLNTFHWHLSDDHGWRIEIKKYPELTKTGAWRVDQTDKSWGERPQAKPGEVPTYGGYYTQQQIKDIVKYAAERSITIVPELDVPGHSAAAIASYPFLSCTQQPQLPMTGGNYSGVSSNLCPGNDSVFTFLQDVYSEVLSLFPSKYIHIGGDEVDKTSWKHCPKCQERMKAEGLKNEEELQSYFVHRMEDFLISQNRKMIGWDEILEGGLAPQAAVMSWRGVAGGIQAAKMGHNVVMTPGSPLYFDHYQGDPQTEPLAFGGFNSLKKVYQYEPVPKELNEEQSKYVLGAQANLWAEHITTPAHVIYMVLPRMPALAEVVWSTKDSRNWKDFNERLQSHFTAFEQKGLPHSKGNFKVDIKPITENGQLLVNLTTEAYKGEVYFTTDGSQPSISSRKFTGPVMIDSTVIFKAVSVVNGKVMSRQPAEQQFVVHKAIGKNVVYASPNSTYYPADGPNTLTNGVKGTDVISQYWHGFSGRNLIATIDLGEETKVQSISLGCLQKYSDWIFLPQYVRFEVSDDGTTFTQLATVDNNISMNEKGSVVQNFKTSFPVRNARYIRVIAQNNVCPPGHPGEGKPAWIFADELIVE